ncbi:hypothetical protein COV12_00015 [Candidatus Woesearchaeota archaeon CG10_big_fil_rev_8_21_14_0_10_32_24]|nr:MAG: hypothetical protein COV12_00015 [Candidatus Woesearchaeota archaeon CG10_big_fil_rev_8_21_14_0_10_32_24]
MEKILAQYSYQGREIGKLVQYNDLGDKELRTDLTLSDAEQLLWDMPVVDKMHIQKRAYGVLKLAEHHRLNPIEYIDNAEVMDYVLENGYKNLNELNRGDRRAWELVRERGLVAKLFPELKPFEE